VDAGTQLRPGQQGGNCAGHCIPFGVQRGPLTLPVPDNRTECGLPAALSVTIICPSTLPEVLGVKVTLIVQLAPAAKLPPQSLVARKFALTTMLVICSVPGPVLRKVTGSELLGWPTTSCPNIRLLADRVRLGAAPGMLLEQAAVMQIPIRIGPTNFFIFGPPIEPDDAESV
jgi:hypothetical protein